MDVEPWNSNKRGSNRKIYYERNSIQDKIIIDI